MKWSVEQQITFLPVQDLERTTRFYEQVLGFSLALDQGDCRIFRVCKGAYIRFCRRAFVPEHSQTVILTFVSQAVDNWYGHLQANHIPIEKPPALNEKYQIYHLFIRDPDGYLIEFQEFCDPNWRE